MNEKEREREREREREPKLFIRVETSHLLFTFLHKIERYCGKSQIKHTLSHKCL